MTIEETVEQLIKNQEKQSETIKMLQQQLLKLAVETVELAKATRGGFRAIGGKP